VHSSQWRAIGGTEPCLSPRANAVPRSVVGLYAHAPFIVNAYRQQIVASQFAAVDCGRFDVRTGICRESGSTDVKFKGTGAINLLVSVWLLIWSCRSHPIVSVSWDERWVGTLCAPRPWTAGKDRPFHGFPPHLSHNVATFWVKDMQCFVDSQPFAATGYPCYGEPDEVVMALRPYRFRASASGGVA
jgi:hypothetical protein